MKKLDIKKYKKLLETELVALEEQLNTVGRRNPSNPDDWEAKQPEENIPGADLNEVADTIDDFENNNAILIALEERWNNIKRALQKIKDGTYGICEENGEQISKERLDANPAARNCTKHMREKQKKS